MDRPLAYVEALRSLTIMGLKLRASCDFPHLCMKLFVLLTERVLLKSRLGLDSSLLSLLLKRRRLSDGDVLPQGGDLILEHLNLLDEHIDLIVFLFELLRKLFLARDRTMMLLSLDIGHRLVLYWR